jgi:hypothetical protein
MKVNYSGDLYIVRWEHRRKYDYSSRKLEEKIATKGGETYCIIFRGKQDDETRFEVGSGTAICHPKDTYCKSFGRKLSLTNALSCCTNKDFRKAFWEQYKKECK